MTVYRHFPNERALFTACSSRFLEQHPPPDLSRSMAIARPAARIEAVLLSIYGYYHVQGLTDAEAAALAARFVLMALALHAGP